MGREKWIFVGILGALLVHYVTGRTYTVNTGSSAFIIVTLTTIVIIKKQINRITLLKNLFVQSGQLPFLIVFNIDVNDHIVF